MGGRAYGLAVARPLPVHAVSLATCPGLQARPMPRGGLRPRRNSGAGGRARRHTRPDAADRQPQCVGQDGECDRARRRRAPQPAAAVCALLARRDRGGVGFLEPDRASARHARAASRDGCARPHSADRRSGRRDVSLFRPHRVHRAGRCGLRHRRPRRDLEGRIRGPRGTSPRGNPRRDRQSRLELHHPSHRPAGDRIVAGAARTPGRAAPGRGGRQPVEHGETTREARVIAGIPLGFAQPLVLLALLSLPVLWWLLRLIPPQPRRIAFPPTRLLFDIAPREETPQRTPWWLTLLRLTLAALVIIAAAGPLWNPPVATSASKAPLAILIDDGFPAAGTWDARMRTAEDLIARADADHRGVALIPLSEPSRDVSFEAPAAARVRLKQIKPKPYAVERAEALPPLGRFLAATPEVELVWLTDGVDLGGGNDFVAALGRLIEQRPITVIEGGIPTAHALTGPDNAAGALTVKVLRASNGGAETGTVRALDLKGLPLGDTSFAFKDGERESEAELTMPVEIRNDIARLEIAGERSAGAVALLDKRWRRRSIGVVTGSTADTAQPLLASTYYLTRALGPFADVRLADRGSPAQAVNQFIQQHLSMLILADVGNVAEAREELSHWVEEGGVLVRFAGPRLAAADTRGSDLPLSGTFVEMLKRIVSLAGVVAPSDASTPNARADREVLPPTRILDGFGAFGPPPASARAVPATFSGRATSDHPPGFYGPAEGFLADRKS